MAKKNHTVEQIIGKLREAEVRLSQGETVGQVSRSLSITEQTCAADDDCAPTAQRRQTAHSAQATCTQSSG